MTVKREKLIDLKAETAHAADRIAIHNFVMAQLRQAQIECSKIDSKMWVDNEVIVKLLCAKNKWDIDELRETITFYNQWLENQCME